MLYLPIQNKLAYKHATYNNKFLKTKFLKNKVAREALSRNYGIFFHEESPLYLLCCNYLVVYFSGSAVCTQRKISIKPITPRPAPLVAISIDLITPGGPVSRNFRIGG